MDSRQVKLDLITRYYKLKLYSNDDLTKFVESGDLTDQEYKDLIDNKE